MMRLLSAPLGVAIVVGYLVIGSAAWFMWGQIWLRRSKLQRSLPGSDRTQEWYRLFFSPPTMTLMVVLEVIILFSLLLIAIVVGMSEPGLVSNRSRVYIVGVAIALFISLVFFGGVNYVIGILIELWQRNPLPDFFTLHATEDGLDEPSDDEVTADEEIL